MYVLVYFLLFGFGWIDVYLMLAVNIVLGYKKKTEIKLGRLPTDRYDALLKTYCI